MEAMVAKTALTMSWGSSVGKVVDEVAAVVVRQRRLQKQLVAEAVASAVSVVMP